MWAYQLTFFTPVHFGLEGIGQERVEQMVRSDTLWAALVQKLLLLYDDEPEGLCREPGFTVSSGFPVIGGCRYFPVPIGSFDRIMDVVAHMDTGQLPFDLKDLKKIRFLSEPLFRKVSAGSELILADITEESVFPPPARLQAVEKETQIFLKVAQRPRVAVDQICGGVREGAFFYCTDQFFDNNSGLFFLASFDNQEIRKRFEVALRLLGDSGLGADRSIGRGCFSFTAAPFEFQSPDTTAAYVLLSLYHPTRQEIERGVLVGEQSAYSLARRSGHAGSHGAHQFRRADCWMLAEGSLLPFAPEGQIPLVLERSAYIPHNVYRCGKAFCLPMAEGGNP
ncbi:MAG: type III-A CRISPR-associated RAMP protein Csm4 [Deltaproteobacteria bacterium RIFOXYD12_FULL_56_24]|nr:MAG: type III-A CRISPR-associated RAMP protein Csm4 [Deltaproteobacteria bacterium RIFOXYD12_FULL_56_24]